MQLISRINIAELVVQQYNKIDSQFLLNANGKLRAEFYQRANVLQVGRQLIGKILVTNFNNQLTAARIVETEAYNGIIDKASHAYNNRRTKRTEVMFANGGVAYVYLCYGIHHLFNVVSATENTPHATLIRAVEPLYGIETMLSRTGKQKVDYSITKGPGNVSKALGIFKEHSGLNLLGNQIYIIDDGFKMSKTAVQVSPRIGVDYAGTDAFLPYRFFIKDNPFVSGKIR